jgi:uncharacterized membrane-anchored protein
VTEIDVVVKKKKKQQKPWQYKFSFALSLVMLLLIVGYFVQSFVEIRKVKPVSVAIERISERVAEQSMESPIAAPPKNF